ncbi:uncharacterized protein CDAR_176592 [Caerostris darwini]|uniref:Uncharacterized protein n=1 Tax=Caerostris darwini TaxID=1538125 RepID=A0AAV4VIP4_9ARAC|nr:uncharacterized protein CDAR_176592 [Caerostris darwini]
MQPDLNISFIKTDFCEISSCSVKLILVSANKNVYFVTNQDSSFNDSSSLGLSKTWTNIECILCGDILLNCSKQLLLLKNSTNEDWQNDCMLSDISSLIPIEYIGKNTEPDYSMNRAVPGIQAKVLAGKCAITKAKSTITKKMEATLDSLQKLNTSSSSNMHIDHHISSFRESLVNLILQEEENNLLEKDTKSKVVLNLQKHWKQLICDRWILCWTFINNDKRSIYNPVLNMWISNHPIQCIQRVIVHKFQEFSVEDQYCKQINPKEKFSVMISFEIPEFNCENLKTYAVLSWYICTIAEFENELFLPMKEKVLTQQQMLLQTDLIASDVFSSELKDISTYGDLAGMKILQQKIVFIFFSLKTDLCNFETILLSACKSNSLLLIESSNMKILVFKKIKSPLYGVHIILRTVDQTFVEAEVFTKNEKETLLLEKYLHQYLPSDVLILTNGMTIDESKQLKQSAVFCMKEEVDLLFSMLNIHNMQETCEKLGVLPGTVVLSKENFLRIRKALHKKECRTDNVMQRLSNFQSFKRIEPSQ